MLLMLIPVIYINFRQVFGSDDQKVFGIFIFCGLGEVKRAGNDNLHINDNNFIMSDRVGGINNYRNSSVLQESDR